MACIQEWLMMARVRYLLSLVIAIYNIRALFTPVEEIKFLDCTFIQLVKCVAMNSRDYYESTDLLSNIFII